jgi:predicted nucleic acid-binding protein
VIVLDASAVLELLLGTPAGARVARRIAAPAETLHAPHLVDLEVAQVLRRFERAGDIDEARGRDALEVLRSLDVARYPHDLLLPRIWQLRDAVTAYDAAYLALAEALAAPLLTTDARLARSRGHRAHVEWLGAA